MAAPLRVNLRAACVSLLTDYVATTSVKMQIYRARPRTIYAPCGFVDTMRVTRVYFGPANVQETMQADVVVIHGPRLPQGGSFDSGDATDQADAFLDGFATWVDENVHEIGGNTTIGYVNGEDDPTYIPDWVPLEEQLTYYATRITLEGYAGSNTI